MGEARRKKNPADESRQDGYSAIPSKMIFRYFAEQIFHSEAISLVRAKERISLNINLRIESLIQ